MGMWFHRIHGLLAAALRDGDAGLARDLMRNLMRRRETPWPLVAVEA